MLRAKGGHEQASVAFVSDGSVQRFIKDTRNLS